MKQRKTPLIVRVLLLTAVLVLALGQAAQATSGVKVPSITILIPLYVMLNRMSLTGHYIAPILAHSAISVPFVTWLMRVGFFAGPPLIGLVADAVGIRWALIVIPAAALLALLLTPALTPPAKENR